MGDGARMEIKLESMSKDFCPQGENGAPRDGREAHIHFCKTFGQPEGNIFHDAPKK